jgi:hypothetical protein
MSLTPLSQWIFATLAFSLASTATAQVAGEVLPPPATGTPTAFGQSMAVSGDRVLVGDYASNNFTGSAHLFERVLGDQWQEVWQFTLSPEFLLAGSAVDLEGDRVAVTAPFLSDWSQAGVLCVFERNLDGSWQEVACLTPSVANEPFFGMSPESVSLSGDRVAVGAEVGPSHPAGSVYIFERDSSGNWSETARLASPAPTTDHDQFGEAVALEGDRLLVGASGQAQFNGPVGKAYLYELDAGQWLLRSTLTVQSSVFSECLGRSVSLVGDRALVGDPCHDSSFTDAGSAFLFERKPDSSWSEIKRLDSPNPEAEESFGQSVSMSTDRILVGTQPDPNNPGPLGSMYAFDASSGGVDFLAEVQVSEASWFGVPLTHDGHRAAGVAFHDLGGGSFERKVHLFDLTYSGQPLQTLADPIAVAVGSARELQLDVGAKFAQHLYLILGSALGTAPGIPLGNGETLPLQPDFYFFLTLQHANVWPMSNSLGTLDAEGRAVATFDLAPGATALAGLTLSHAAVIVDPITQVPMIASNAVMFALE